MDTLDKMIDLLFAERGEKTPDLEGYDKRRVWRSLVNVRPPEPIGEEYLALEDEYLQRRLREQPVTSLADLTPKEGDLYLWKGDITTLAVDGIVNAANSELLGCFAPCHACIDNCIHTFAGVRLRLACYRLMRRQGHPEGTGLAKITPAYNLPSRYVLHTVGPIVRGRVSEQDEKLLASCYTECLRLADQRGLGSIAFCCISTGVFGYPKEPAAEVALRTVREYKAATHSPIKVVFNVFGEEDYEIYERLFQRDRQD